MFHKEHDYKKTVDILGRGVTVSASVPIYGSVAINAGRAVSQRTEDEKMSMQSAQGRLILLLYNTQPLKLQVSPLKGPTWR